MRRWMVRRIARGTAGTPSALESQTCCSSRRRRFSDRDLRISSRCDRHRDVRGTIPLLGMRPPFSLQLGRPCGFLMAPSRLPHPFAALIVFLIVLVAPAASGSVADDPDDLYRRRENLASAMRAADLWTSNAD